MTKEKELTLHPEHGVNPRLTHCPRCGGKSNGLVMLGIRSYVDQCSSCGMRHYGGADKKRCQSCGSRSLSRRELDLHETVPGPLCAACEESDKDIEKVIAAGGILVRCKVCGMQGALLYDNHKELCDEVRQKSGVPFGKPCGLELESCDQHGGKKEA